MSMSAMVISILLTVFILVLSLVTISKGYGFKHTVDPIKPDETNENPEEKQQIDN